MARRWNVPYVEATAKESVDHIFAHLLYDMEAARGTIVLPSGAVIISLISTTLCACAGAGACAVVCAKWHLRLQRRRRNRPPRKRRLTRTRPGNRTCWPW
jgi:hypothetical protein